MIIVKILLILILTTTFILFSFSQRFKIMQKMTLIFFYFTLFLFILFPKLTDDIAKSISVSSGTDLIVYITLAIMSTISAILYIKIRVNNQMITKIIREEAINNAKKCK